MSEARDLVIVGGGPAGTTTAIALARKAPELARRIVVVERGTYPREKYCAGAMGARGEKILAELGAMPDVASAPVNGISLATRDGEISARTGSIGRVVRRIEFDHGLAKIADSLGVEVRDGTRVDSISTTGKEKGEGALVETSRGAIRARVVVGADGVGSVVRKALGLGAGKLRAQVLEIDTEPVASDRPRDLLHFDAKDRRLPGYYWDFPTVVGGKELVCRGVYLLKVEGQGEVDIQSLFAERLRGQGLELSRYKNKRYAERGFDPKEPIARGPLMLVGEAAGIDPVTGEGIAQAIEYGANAGSFLVKALATGGPASTGAWTRSLGTSRLSRDLQIRLAVVNLFYGYARADIERFLLESPDTLHVGCQHFANEPYDKARLCGVIVRGAAQWLGAGIRQALA